MKTIFDSCPHEEQMIKDQVAKLNVPNPSFTEVLACLYYRQGHSPQQAVNRAVNHELSRGVK